MQKRKNLLIAGSIVTDITITCPELEICANKHALALPIGKKIAANYGFFSYGGSAYNTSITASKLNTQVYVCSRIQNNELGVSAIKKLQETNINTTHLQVSDIKEGGISCIIETVGHETSLISYKPKELNIQAKDITTAIAGISHLESIYLGPLTHGCIIDIAPTIKNLRSTQQSPFIAHNPSMDEILYAPKTLQNILPTIQLFILNLHEANVLIEKLTGKITEKKELLQQFYQWAPNTSCIITDGTNGTWYWEENQAKHAPAHPVKIQRTTGAGDVFGITCTCALIAQKNLTLAIQEATSNAAHALRYKNLEEGTLNPSEIETQHFKT